VNLEVPTSKLLLAQVTPIVAISTQLEHRLRVREARRFTVVLLCCRSLLLLMMRMVVLL
jgi:hypothetical protein